MREVELKHAKTHPAQAETDGHSYKSRALEQAHGKDRLFNFSLNPAKEHKREYADTKHDPTLWLIPSKSWPTT